MELDRRGRFLWWLKSENAFAVMSAGRVAIPGQRRLCVARAGKQDSHALHILTQLCGVAADRYLEVPTRGGGRQISRCDFHRHTTFAIRLRF
jgi:hypothetical protein